MWVSTLDFFLGQQYIKDGIKEYVDKQKANWMKWFRTELGENIMHQICSRTFHKMMKSPYVYKDYVSLSYIRGTILEHDTAYR